MQLLVSVFKVRRVREKSVTPLTLALIPEIKRSNRLDLFRSNVCGTTGAMYVKFDMDVDKHTCIPA